MCYSFYSNGIGKESNDDAYNVFGIFDILNTYDMDSMKQNAMNG